MDKQEKIEAYFAKQEKWADGLSRLRKAVIESGFKEELKWGMPTYTIDGKNLIGLSGFKNHFGVWFHQGSFLSDPLKLLENAQEGKTKGMRHIKYMSSDEVNIEALQAYFDETKENHKAGKVIKVEKNVNKYEMPEILNDALVGEVKEGFDNMSKSKQNEFIEYIVTAKRDATKASRLEKIIPMILRGEGLNDKYKK